MKDVMDLAWRYVLGATLFALAAYGVTLLK